jgi:hypothetical protein
MNRPENMAPSYLLTQMSSLAAMIKDLRATQTFGSSNFAIYLLQKPTADLSVIIPASGYATVEVTLTPTASAISNPSIALGFEVVRMSGTSTIFVSVVPQAPVSGVQKWHVYFNYLATAGTIPYRFKFLTIAPGTWTAVQTA